MTVTELKRFVVADFKRQACFPTFAKVLPRLLFNYSTQICFWFRVCAYLRTKPLKCWGIYFFAYAIYRHFQFKTGIQLPVQTCVGGGLGFAHHGYTVVHDKSVLGCDILLFQGVTIGSARYPKHASPIIGDRVVIAAGAQVIGGITIGNDVFIGAGAVVVKDVPSGVVVGGNPARILNYNGAARVKDYLFPASCEN